MRWPAFILLQCLLIGVVAGIIYLHKDRVAMVKSYWGQVLHSNIT